MPSTAHPDDERFMRRCFELARRGLGHTRANPIVGAVLVHEGDIIGEGWHREWGGPHAEVECFDSVPPEEKHLIPASTLYCSLEPCAHWGKQPPCAARIVEEDIRRVVVSVDDPYPQVGGRGYEILERAGVQVLRGVLRVDGRWLARRFLSLHEQGRPYIILKWAQSADGFIAPPHGHRVMLSSAVSQRLVHKWRTEEDAILVGYRTALLDNPRLTARLWEGPQPLRVFLDRDGSLPRTHNLFDGEVPTWCVMKNSAPELPHSVRAIQADAGEEILPNLLAELKAANISSIIVEGGGATLHTFMQAGLWDEARIFQTPVTLGSGVAAPQLQDVGSATRLAVDGDDFLSLFTRSGSPYSYPAGSLI